MGAARPRPLGAGMDPAFTEGQAQTVDVALWGLVTLALLLFS